MFSYIYKTRINTCQQLSQYTINMVTKYMSIYHQHGDQVHVNTPSTWKTTTCQYTLNMETTLNVESSYKFSISKNNISNRITQLDQLVHYRSICKSVANGDTGMNIVNIRRRFRSETFIIYS